MLYGLLNAYCDSNTPFLRTHLPLLSTAVLQLCLFGWLRRTSSTFSTPEEGRFVCECVCMIEGRHTFHLLPTAPLPHINTLQPVYWVSVCIKFIFSSILSSLYSDGQFPIEISSVTRDHDFLDQDAIEALCR